MTDIEQQLRDVMRTAVADLPLPAGMYDRIRVRRRRQQRRAVVLAALAVTALLSAVPLIAQAQLRAHSVPAAARGSLATDIGALAEAEAYADAHVFVGADQVDSGSVQVAFAGREAGYSVALVTAERDAHSQHTTAFVGRKPGATTWQELYSGPGEMGTDPADQVLTTVTFVEAGGGLSQSFGVLVVPPTWTATMLTDVRVGADCRRTQGVTERVPLTDGTALVPISPGDSPYVTVRNDAGATVLAKSLGRSAYRPPPTELVPGVPRPDGWLPGSRDISTVAAVADSSGVSEVPRRYAVIWSAKLAAGAAYLAGAEYGSGAMVLLGRFTPTRGAGTNWAVGCLPAGQLPLLVLAAVVGPSGEVATIARSGTGVAYTCIEPGGGSRPAGGAGGMVSAEQPAGCVSVTDVAATTRPSRPATKLVPLPLR